MLYRVLVLISIRFARLFVIVISGMFIFYQSAGALPTKATQADFLLEKNFKGGTLFKNGGGAPCKHPL